MSGNEEELRQAFDMFDRDHSGKISARELKSVFKALDINATDAEIRATLKQMDIDGDGEISFTEFNRIMGEKFFRKYSENEIREAFEYFDQDNSGYITREELKQVLIKLGREFDDDDIDRMISSIDDDGNGKISLSEFTQLLK